MLQEWAYTVQRGKGLKNNLLRDYFTHLLINAENLMLKMLSLFKIFSKKNYLLKVTSLLSTWGVERCSIIIYYIMYLFPEQYFTKEISKTAKTIAHVHSSAEDSTVEA